MELASRIDFDTYLDAKRRRFEYVRAFDDLVGDDTVLLSPTMCVEGFPADGVMPEPITPARRPRSTTPTSRT